MIENENNSPNTAEREAANILKQVERDSRSIVLGGMPSTSRANEPAPGDAVELWGRRIGRVFAVIAAVIAVIWLLTSIA